jgi:hypothetical protein
MTEREAQEWLNWYIMNVDTWVKVPSCENVWIETHAGREYIHVGFAS